MMPALPDEHYRAAIAIHCPNEDDMAMAVRIELAKLRDRAAAGMRRCSDDTYPFLLEISRLATTAVYARATAADLLRLEAGLSTILMGARIIERPTGPRSRTA